MSKRSFKGLVVVPGVGSSGLGVGVFEASAGLDVDSAAVHPGRMTMRKIERAAQRDERDDHGWRNTR
jgi:hypothetical protein